MFYCQLRNDDRSWSTAKSTHARVGKGMCAHDEAQKEATAWAPHQSGAVRQAREVDQESRTPLLRQNANRGTFLPDEIHALFAADWPDRRYLVANKTAAATGLRASEIAEFRETKIHPEYLEVDQRWSPRYKEGPTKTGKPRIVPIPSSVYRDFAEHIKENPHKGDGRYVFYSIDPAHPMNQREFTEALVKRMEAVGISDDPNWQKEGRAPLRGSRQARGLDFHAWRQSYNSLLVDSRVPFQTIQSVTGHLCDEMTQRYYNIGGEAGEGIRRIAEGIFAESKPRRGSQRSPRIARSKTKRPSARR